MHDGQCLHHSSCIRQREDDKGGIKPWILGAFSPCGRQSAANDDVGERMVQTEVCMREAEHDEGNLHTPPLMHDYCGIGTFPRS